MSTETDLIEKYIAGFPEEIQQICQQMRTIIKNAAPDSKEIISYGMPAYHQSGNLVYFAAHTHHIGLYPTSSAVEQFKSELKEYKHSKGAIQFPYQKPLPVDLISRIVHFRVASIKSKVKKGKS